jgi:hypothetical protein
MTKVIDGVLNTLNAPAETAGLEPAYSVQQLVKHYGNSESFWRKELARRKLKYFKLGSLTRISQSALIDYLAEGKRK